ncbi:MAG: rhomboid family intramembrane serine protease [Chitinophagales bacterium]
MPVISYGLMAMIVVISLMAFQRSEWFNALCSWPYEMVREKQWYRMLSSGFIHADFGHLFFNMFTFFFFGPIVESYFNILIPGFGKLVFLLFFLMAIVVAGVPDAWKHRDDYGYHAVGASGGISAVLFASIIFDPWERIGFLFPGLEIPGIFFAPLYILFSFYMSRSGRDNIGHMAHITGGIFGFIFPFLIRPGLLIYFFNNLFMR